MGKPGRKPDPRTPAEWREAVDLAAFYRLLWDCRLYGLLEGSLFDRRPNRPADAGGGINVARCDYILDKGERMGIRPAPAGELADRYVPMLAEAGMLEGWSPGPDERIRAAASAAAPAPTTKGAQD